MRATQSVIAQHNNKQRNSYWQKVNEFVYKYIVYFCFSYVDLHIFCHIFCDGTNTADFYYCTEVAFKNCIVVERKNKAFDSE